MQLRQFLLNDLHSGRLWLHLAILAAMVTFMVTMSAWDRTWRLQAFARKWQIDRSEAHRLYSRHFGFPNQNWTWVWALPFFAAVLLILPLCMVPVAGGMELMAELEIYVLPLTVTAMGAHLLAMPVEELRYRHRLIRLKPADVGNPTAVADIEAALRGGTQRFVYVRVIGAIFMAIGLAMVAGVLFCHPMEWVDLVLRHCPRC